MIAVLSALVGARAEALPQRSGQESPLQLVGDPVGVASVLHDQRLPEDHGTE
jgi:hypothetical protein